MRKVHDAQQAKDDRQPQAEQGVKGAIHQTEQQLAQKSLQRNAKNFSHKRSIT